jgi:hypothetical protein
LEEVGFPPPPLVVVLRRCLGLSCLCFDALGSRSIMRTWLVVAGISKMSFPSQRTETFLVAAVAMACTNESLYDYGVTLAVAVCRKE